MINLIILTTLILFLLSKDFKSIVEKEILILIL